MILVWAATFLEMVMKQLQYLFRLFVALIALLSARAVYARQEVLLKIDVIRLDPRLDKLVQLNAKIEKIAGGHKWVEGPVWNRKKNTFSFLTSRTIQSTNGRKEEAKACF
jgi:hypothetical protein